MSEAMINRIDHASLIVSDTARALRFYHEVLGLEVDDGRPDLGYPGAWLKVGPAQIHLLELPNPDPVDKRPEHGGRDRHIALVVNDLEALLSRLQQAGFAFSRSKSGRKAAFCRDADGNAIELLQKNT